MNRVLLKGRMQEQQDGYSIAPTEFDVQVSTDFNNSSHSTDSQSDSDSEDSNSTKDSEKSEIWTERNLVNYRQIVAHVTKNSLQDTLRICLSGQLDPSKKTNWPLKPSHVPRSSSLDLNQELAFLYQSLLESEDLQQSDSQSVIHES